MTVNPNIGNKMEKELIGFINEEMTDEEVLAFIDEFEAEESARIELADHAMNNEV
tara:strand:- start:334 stop:498 length:165 start_codon:yes stop_codon:yes gene_type:complete